MRINPVPHLKKEKYMRKEKYSRILSFLLTLCMVVSLLPTTLPTISAEEAGDGMHFNFSAKSFGEESDISEDAIDANDASSTPEFATVNTDPWRIDGQHRKIPMPRTFRTQSQMHFIGMFTVIPISTRFQVPVVPMPHWC